MNKANFTLCVFLLSFITYKKFNMKAPNLLPLLTAALLLVAAGPKETEAAPDRPAQTTDGVLSQCHEQLDIAMASYSVANAVAAGARNCTLAKEMRQLGFDAEGKASKVCAGLVEPHKVAIMERQERIETWRRDTDKEITDNCK